MDYVVVDGRSYKKGTEPDMGSLFCTESETVSGNNNEPLDLRSYEGLSIDASKLPHYKDLATGSSFFCVDTGDLYKYERTTDQWMRL